MQQLNFCYKVLNELMGRKCKAFNWPFLVPVDVEGMNLSDYYEIISKPMDLGTIRKKLDNKEYTSAQEFADDVRLVCSNCFLYNPTTDAIHQHGRSLLRAFEERWSHLPVDEGVKSNVATSCNMDDDDRLDFFLNHATIQRKKFQECAEQLEKYCEEMVQLQLKRKEAKLSDTPMPPLPQSLLNSVQQTLGQCGSAVQAFTPTNRVDQEPIRHTSDGSPLSTAPASPISPSPRKNPKSPSNSNSSNTCNEHSNLYCGHSQRTDFAKKFKARILEYGKPWKDSYEFDSGDEASHKPMSYDEKRRLCMNLDKLNGYKLSMIIGIIKSREDLSSSSPDEIEIDFETLKDVTLRDIEAFLASAHKRKLEEALRSDNKIQKREIDDKIGKLEETVSSQHSTGSTSTTDGSLHSTTRTRSLSEFSTGSTSSPLYSSSNSSDSESESMFFSEQEHAQLDLLKNDESFPMDSYITNPSSDEDISADLESGMLGTPPRAQDRTSPQDSTFCYVNTSPSTDSTSLDRYVEVVSAAADAAEALLNKRDTSITEMNSKKYAHYGVSLSDEDEDNFSTSYEAAVSTRATDSMSVECFREAFSENNTTGVSSIVTGILAGVLRLYPASPEYSPLASRSSSLPPVLRARSPSRRNLTGASEFDRNKVLMGRRFRSYSVPPTPIRGYYTAAVDGLSSSSCEDISAQQMQYGLKLTKSPIKTMENIDEHPSDECYNKPVVSSKTLRIPRNELLCSDSKAVRPRKAAGADNVSSSSSFSADNRMTASHKMSSPDASVVVDHSKTKNREHQRKTVQKSSQKSSSNVPDILDILDTNPSSMPTRAAGKSEESRHRAKSKEANKQQQRIDNEQRHRRRSEQRITGRTTEERRHDPVRGEQSSSSSRHAFHESDHSRRSRRDGYRLATSRDTYREFRGARDAYKRDRSKKRWRRESYYDRSSYYRQRHKHSHSYNQYSSREQSQRATSPGPSTTCESVTSFVLTAEGARLRLKEQERRVRELANDDNFHSQAEMMAKFEANF